MNVSILKTRKRSLNLRRFLFQTAPGSGAEPGFPPLTEADDLGADSRSPLPVFATRRGLGTAETEGPDCAAAEPAAGLFSPSFEVAVPVAPLAARNVLFTVTALKVVGFLTADVALALPLSSTWSFGFSPLGASVSEPLILGAAEVDCTVLSFSNLSPSIVGASPFTGGGGEMEGTSC